MYHCFCEHTNKDIFNLHKPKGSLSGLNFVCSDLFDVVGQKTSAGNPDFLLKREIAKETAPLIQVRNCTT
jgi:hypothetical protein